MNYGAAQLYLEATMDFLNEGNVQAARNTLAEAAVEFVVEDLEYGAWTYGTPPLEEGILDLVKNATVHKVAQKLGVHTKTNVRADLQGLHNQGQAAIGHSHSAAEYTGTLHKKKAKNQGDPEAAMSQHHSAVKSHQAMLAKLDRAHKSALAAKDHDAAAWISHAKDVHNTHRDWNMKQARNLRAHASAGTQALAKSGAMPAQSHPSHAAAPAAHKPPPQQQMPAARAGQGVPPGGQAAPQRRGNFNTQTGKPHQQHGQNPAGAGGLSPGYGGNPHPGAPRAPAAPASAPGKKRFRKKAANESAILRIPSYARLAESLKE